MSVSKQSQSQEHEAEQPIKHEPVVKVSAARVREIALAVSKARSVIRKYRFMVEDLERLAVELEKHEKPVVGGDAKGE
jgi:hypothetical protein